MIYFLVILLPGLVWPFIAKTIWGREITWKELLINLGIGIVTAVILAIGLNLGTKAKLWDTEILNGKVVSKQRTPVSCEHSYECNCYRSCTGSGSSKTCTRICSTCYEHSRDYDWDVKTTVGTITIDRINRQGTKEPPRFSKVEIGEPVSKTNSYLNYLKGSKNSIFYVSKEDSKYTNLPEYPKVYDYYRINRVLNQTSIDTKGWNDYLNMKLTIYGKSKQVNLVILITEKPEDYFNEMVSNWDGVKKNDVVIGYGIRDSNIFWFKATSFADGERNKELFNLMRQQALGNKLDLGMLKSNTDLVFEKFSRVPNEEYSYILESIRPSGLAIFIMTLINLVISIFISFKLATNYEKEYK